MKRFITLVVFIVLCLTSGLALAAPLDDADKAGNVALTVYGIDAQQKMKYNFAYGSGTFKSDKDINLGLSLDVTVAPKIILSVDYMKNKSGWKSPAFVEDGWAWGSGWENTLKSTALKVKYQAYKYKNLFVAPYIGFARNKTTWQGGFHDGDNDDAWTTEKFHSNTKSSILVGVTLVANLDKKENFKGYLDAGVGDKLYSYNLGISVAATKNFEIDFGYKFYKVKNLKSAYYVDEVGSEWMTGLRGKQDVTVKGFYLGLTLKFK